MAPAPISLNAVRGAAVEMRTLRQGTEPRHGDHGRAAHQVVPETHQASGGEASEPFASHIFDGEREVANRAGGGGPVHCSKGPTFTSAKMYPIERPQLPSAARTAESCHRIRCDA